MIIQIVPNICLYIIHHVTGVNIVTNFLHLITIIDLQIPGVVGVKVE